MQSPSPETLAAPAGLPSSDPAMLVWLTEKKRCALMQLHTNNWIKRESKTCLSWAKQWQRKGWLPSAGSMALQIASNGHDSTEPRTQIGDGVYKIAHPDEDDWIIKKQSSSDWWAKWCAAPYFGILSDGKHGPADTKTWKAIYSCKSQRWLC